jgi:hypothetical protein
MSKFWKVFLSVLGSLAVLGMAGLFFVLALGRFMPMMGFSRGIRHGMMPFGGFMWFGMLLRFVLPLLVISLLVLVGIWIGRSSRKPTVTPIAPAVEQNIAAAVPVPPTTPVCASCGKELSEEWVVCPYCGTHK